jgi:hypothetical protein
MKAIHPPSWLLFTPQERLVLGGVLLIFLIGLAARQVYLSREPSGDPDRPDATGTRRAP